MSFHLVHKLIREDVLGVRSYEVSDARGMIKLDAMENPFALPKVIADELGSRLGSCALNRYPDPRAHALQRQLRRVMKIAPEYEILLGNGSDELIQVLISAVSRPGAKIMAPAPSFVMYRTIADACRQSFVELPLDERFDLAADSLAELLDRERPALLFLASPNNPSGNQFSEERMRAAISACPGLVVIDEAYFAFTGRHHDSWLAQFDNLLIMRTLSKLGLAGLRLGFMWGNPAWIHEFDKLRLPYNINTLTQVAAEVALQHFDLLLAQVEQLRREREHLTERLSGFDMLDPVPSEANFVLVRVRDGRARAIYESLRDAGILVKCVDGSHPSLSSCLRITVGTRSENDCLIKALKNIA